ncbi:MAG: N-acetylglucosamine-6-phosphate deacetylase [Lachnospiraceae bacterium]|nr:N-acetylglucosamine-6-phosphate deacetylase [Lachnospiraceae bacterium]
MKIINGLVFRENKTFKKLDITIKDHIITAIDDDVRDDYSSCVEEECIDARGLYVIPGLIDIHSHGAFGHDFSDNDIEGLYSILSYEYEHGITSYCPTSMSLDKDTLKSIYASVKGYERKPGHAKIAGLNMEGPFLDPKKKGVHKEEHLLNPDIDFFKECNELSNNMIKLVTLAPNLPGANEFIKELSSVTNISLGHSLSSYEEATEAFQNGANHVTHLFNAMSPISHREPGLIPAAFDNKDIMVELICDGLHIHDSMVRLAFSMFKDRLILVSDSMRATGLLDGIYELGGQTVKVSQKKATLLTKENATGTLLVTKEPSPNDTVTKEPSPNDTASNAPMKETIAGSVCDLYDCMRMAIKIGIPPEDAIYASTIAPARSINIYDETGSISVGKASDLLLVDQNYNLIKVIS